MSDSTDRILAAMDKRRVRLARWMSQQDQEMIRLECLAFNEERRATHGLLNTFIGSPTTTPLFSKHGDRLTGLICTGGEIGPPLDPYIDPTDEELDAIPPSISPE